MITYEIHSVHDKLEYLKSYEEKHYEDIKDKSMYPEINMCWDVYKELSEAGLCKVVIAYDKGEPVAYAAFTITLDLNNGSSNMAYQVAMYIERKYRGRLVVDFIEECGKLLGEEGVSKILCAHSDVRIGKILGKAGYAPESINWVKTI